MEESQMTKIKKMTEILIIAVWAMSICSLYPIQIEQITEISNGVMLFDYDYHNGDIKGFEDRVIMKNMYSIEEFEVLADGTLNRIAHFETTASRVNGSLYINENRLYVFNARETPFGEEYAGIGDYFFRVFDLTQRPMVEIVEFDTPEVKSGAVVSVNFQGVYIYISFLNLFEVHQTAKYSIETFTFEGFVVPALGGSWVRIEGDILLNMWTTGAGYYRLMFYEFIDDQMIYLNDFVLPIHVSVGSGSIHYIWESNYVYTHYEGVIIVDFSDVMNPFLVADIRGDYPHRIIDSYYSGDFVVLSNSAARLWVYEKNEVEEFTLQWTNEAPFFGSGASSRSIYIKDNFIFHQRGIDMIVIDMDIDFSEVFKHSNYNMIPLYFTSPQKNDFYYLKLDWQTFSFDIYSIFDNDLVVSREDENQVVQYIYQFQIENDKLYILLLRQGVPLFEIYDIIDYQAHLVSSWSLPPRSLTSFILTSDRVYFDSANGDGIDIFSIDGSYLDWIRNENLESRHTGSDTDDFIITHSGTTVSFRNKNDHEDIILSASLPITIGYIYRIDKNYIIVYQQPPIGSERTAHIYRYNVDEGSISHFHTFPTNLGTTVYSFAGTIADNAWQKETSEYFSILSNKLVKIGEKEDRNRVVWNTFFYPEKNKMVQLAMSGIWVYDIEYDEYVSGADIAIYPMRNELLGNYPNPFNPETTIGFNITVESIVSIDIYNIRGQKMRRLFEGFVESGSHTVVWDGKDDNSRELGSGVYFYRMIAGDVVETRKMVLLK